MLGQSCHESIRGIVEFGIGGLAGHALLQIGQRLGDRNGQHRDDAILQDVDKRSQAEKRHDAEVLG